jgi:hypothetical protein
MWTKILDNAGATTASEPGLTRTATKENRLSNETDFNKVLRIREVVEWNVWLAAFGPAFVAASSNLPVELDI